MLGSHDDVKFKLSDGASVKLIWEKPEYKAYILRKGEWVYMRLGGTNSENLKQYILRKDSTEWMRSIMG